MTGGLLELALASVAFVGLHFVLSHSSVRQGLIKALGEGAFRSIYSLGALIAFTWMILAYRAAPFVELFAPMMFLSHLPMTLMLLACLFFVCGFTCANPSAVGLEKLPREDNIPGILKITRHPVMWGFGIWAISHMVANPDLAAWMFFGAIAVLALGGAVHIDYRKIIQEDPDWIRMSEKTSWFPFAAILSGRTSVTMTEIGWWRILLGIALYAVMLWMHSDVFGVSPMPMPGEL